MDTFQSVQGLSLQQNPRPSRVVVYSMSMCARMHDPSPHVALCLPSDSKHAP